MNRFSFFLLLLLLLETGCKKSGHQQNTSLYGTWELRGAQGGMTPYKTYTAGNGNKLIFSAVTYQRYVNNTVVAQGGYSIVRDKSVEQTVGLTEPAGTFQQRIQFNNAADPKTFFQIDGDQLQLVSGFFPLDGGSYMVYEKISE